MATHWGTEGTVTYNSGGLVTVAEIVEFEFTESVAPVDDTAMGDTYKTHIAGSAIKQWSGTVTCHWDEDFAPSENLGAAVTLALYPEGSSGGDVYYTGSARVNESSIAVKMDGETIRMSFAFVGSGALTLSAV